MGRPAHDVVSDADRIHNVEGKERDMRRLEHIAAGIEDEVRLGVAVCRGRPIGALAEPLQQDVVELQA